ncbi:MAG: phage tail tape measure protein [Paraclostridium sp.]|uniref:phage tail tape measure protein n=1 Tax=Paraclostridium sp. TaxID=2023273 RepID=UPI003EE6C78C
MSMNLGTAIAYIDIDANKFTRGMSEIQSGLRTFNDKTLDTSTRFKALGSTMQSTGRKMTLGVTLPLAGMAGAAAKSAIDFESAFAGVRKTVDASESDMRKLESGIRDMAKEMPTAATEIAGVAEAAGQLGIKTPNILDFTKTMVMLGDSTTMSAEESATSLARLANITGMSQGDFDRLGSTIVALGNNMATTESEITAMGLRLAGAGSQVGMTEPQIMSFAAALSSVGIEAEAGGSAFSKVMVDMQLATEKGGKKLNQFAKVAGMSASDFKKAFETDASGAIMKFIEGLGSAEERGESAIGILDGMGISEVRMRDALLRAAGASDVFSEALGIGTQAWKENNALTNEYNQRAETTASKLSILKNNLVDVGIEIGGILIPYIQDFVGWLQGLIEKFQGLEPSTQDFIVKAGAMVAIIGPLLMIFGSLITAVTTISGALSGLSGVFGLVSGAVTSAGGALTGAAGAAAGFTLGLPVLVAGLVAVAATIGSNTSALDFLVDKFGFAGRAIATMCETMWGIIQFVFGNICIIIETTAKLIYAAMTGQFSKLDDITREGWAKIENNTAKSLSNMNADTTNALKLIETQSSAELDKITNVYDTALSKLPELTKHNVGDAATEFTNSLKGIDEEGMTILKGTSDTMAIILEGINADMIGTEKGTDKMKANLESLAVSGGISATDLQKEVDKAMKTINDNMVTESDLMKQNATNAFNAFKTVGTSSVKEMANNVVAEIGNMEQGSVEKLSGMGETWKGILSGVKDDGSMSSAQMRDMIVQNLSDMNINGSELVNQLRTESTNHMNQMADEADKATKKGADAVNKNTQDAKTKAVENAKGTKDGSKQELDKIPQDAQSAMSKAAQNMDQQSKAGKDAVSNNMKQTSKVVMDESGKIPKDVQSNMSKSVQSMKQAGSDIYNGMNTSFAKTSSQGKKHFSDLFNGVTRSTSKMSSKVISDWNRIRSALSGTITGNVQIKVHGVQAALNQISSVKNAAKTRSVSPMPFMNLMAMPQNFAMPIDTNMYAQAYDMIRSNDIASYVSSQIPSAINLNIDSNNSSKSKKTNNPNINVEVKIEKVENKTSDSPKEIAEQVVDQVIYKLKREKYATGGA